MLTVDKSDPRLMRHLEQEGPTCGQTCVAMVAGVEVEEVCQLLDNWEGTTPNQLQWVAGKLGVDLVGLWCDSWDLLPASCFVRVWAGVSYHMLVRVGYLFYGPHGERFFDLPVKYKFKNYLEFNADMCKVDYGVDGLIIDGLIRRC